MTHIIAVSGPIGGGKSSLTSAIAGYLGDASILQFDSYETLTQAPIENLLDWLETGASADAFSFPLLEEHLAQLRRGEPVVDPRLGHTVRPEKYVLFETPFGRCYPPAAPFIDLQVWIELPLDIALARKIEEYVAIFLESGNPAEHVKQLVWLKNYLVSYQKMISRILRIQAKHVKPTADVLVNGQKPIEVTAPVTAKEIVRRLEARKASHPR